MKIQNSIDIHAPRDLVFDVFTDLPLAADRISGISRLELLQNAESFQLGTRWRETRKMFGKEATEEMWVTGLTPPSGYIVEAESRGTHYTSTSEFKAKGDTTRVNTTFEGTPLTFATKLMGLIAPLFARATRKMVQDDLEDLKRACEEAARSH